MSTATRTRKPRQVKRTVLLSLEPFQSNPGVVEIRVTSGVKAPRTELFEYLVFPLATDFGRGFRLDKFRNPGDETQPETYQVNLDGPKSACTCKGHLAHGHCKHVDGLAALVKAGKL
jgi:hypothetical protein